MLRARQMSSIASSSARPWPASAASRPSRAMTRACKALEVQRLARCSLLPPSARQAHAAQRTCESGCGASTTVQQGNRPHSGSCCRRYGLVLQPRAACFTLGAGRALLPAQHAASPPAAPLPPSAAPAPALTLVAPSLLRGVEGHLHEAGAHADGGCTDGLLVGLQHSGGRGARAGRCAQASPPCSPCAAHRRLGRGWPHTAPQHGHRLD